MDYSAVITQLRGISQKKSRFKTVAQLNADVCWPSEWTALSQPYSLYDWRKSNTWSPFGMSEVRSKPESLVADCSVPALWWIIIYRIICRSLNDKESGKTDTMQMDIGTRINTKSKSLLDGHPLPMSTMFDRRPLTRWCVILLTDRTNNNMTERNEHITPPCLGGVINKNEKGGCNWLIVKNNVKL